MSSVGFDDCVVLADAAYMIPATILVLGMIPGLGFFECGLLPSTITTSVLSQIMALLPTLGMMWILFGYSLSFGNQSRPFIGNFENALFIGVSASSCHYTFATTIPEQLFALFQMMFAIITPLLMTGAYAGRMRFTAAMIFTIVWEIVVYYVCCHWIWGNGWMAKLGVLDFAGGIVIHTSAGVSALVAAWWVGKRPDFIKHNGEVPPSNIAMACVGTALLWTGWFGFNGGSAFNVSPVTVSAVVNTQVAAVAAGLVWILLSRLEHGHTSVIPAINGSIAGLAGVTPACGYITVGSALVLGLVLGVACYGGVIVLKRWLKIDDALDVSVVHGLSGIIGALAIGICATSTVNPTSVTIEGALYGGGGKLFGLQLMAVVVVALWSAAFSAIILFVLQHTVGLLHVVGDDSVTKSGSSISSTAGVSDADPASSDSDTLPQCSSDKKYIDTANHLDHLDHRESRAYRLDGSDGNRTSNSIDIV